MLDKLQKEYLTKNDKFYECFICGRTFHEDDCTTHDGESVCLSCYRELPYCQNCHEVKEDFDIWTDDGAFCDEQCLEEWKEVNE